MIFLQQQNNLTCHESYAAFTKKIGVVICDTKYCGKKHYKIVQRSSISNTKERIAKVEDKTKIQKLTSPGLSLEVQDEGKFFAEPY